MFSLFFSPKGQITRPPFAGALAVLCLLYYFSSEIVVSIIGPVVWPLISDFSDLGSAITTVLGVVLVLIATILLGTWIAMCLVAKRSRDMSDTTYSHRIFVVTFAVVAFFSSPYFSFVFPSVASNQFGSFLSAEKQDFLLLLIVLTIVLLLKGGSLEQNDFEPEINNNGKIRS
ncbi:MAG: hypothetical protein V3V02_01440 [Rhizobiaceae bacterium]